MTDFETKARAAAKLHEGEYSHRDASEDEASIAYLSYLAGSQWGHEHTLEAAKAMLESFGKFRREIREILHENGVPSNPGWTDQNVLDHIRTLIPQPAEMKK